MIRLQRERRHNHIFKPISVDITCRGPIRNSKLRVGKINDGNVGKTRPCIVAQVCRSQTRCVTTAEGHQNVIKSILVYICDGKTCCTGTSPAGESSNSPRLDSLLTPHRQLDVKTAISLGECEIHFAIMVEVRCHDVNGPCCAFARLHVSNDSSLNLALKPAFLSPRR